MRRPSEKVEEHLTNHRAPGLQGQEVRGLSLASLGWILSTLEKPSVDLGLACERGTWKPPRTRAHEKGSPWRRATGLDPGSRPTPPPRL